jgi:hypothetical protein
LISPLVPSTTLFHFHFDMLLHLLFVLTSISNEYMKVQLAKLKADAEKSGKKSDHKVSDYPHSLEQKLIRSQENFKKVATMWASA